MYVWFENEIAFFSSGVRFLKREIDAVNRCTMPMHVLCAHIFRFRLIFIARLCFFFSLFFLLGLFWPREDGKMSKNSKGKGRNTVSDDFGPPLGAPRRRNQAPAPAQQPAASTGAWATPAPTPAPKPAAFTGAWATPAAPSAPVASAWGQPGQQGAAASNRPSGTTMFFYFLPMQDKETEKCCEHNFLKTNPGNFYQRSRFLWKKAIFNVDSFTMHCFVVVIGRDHWRILPDSVRS